MAFAFPFGEGSGLKASLAAFFGVSLGAGVGQNERAHCRGVLAVEGEGHVPAHGKPSQHHPPQLQLCEQGVHVVGKQLHAGIPRTEG